MREFLYTGVGIVALVFSILGVVFTCTGLALATFVKAQVVGITFLILGGGVLAAGVMFAILRLAALRRRARLLETGQESRGTILELAPNRHVRLGGRRPWVVRYRYEVQGREYQGSETFMDLPAGYEAGASVALMYDPAHVEVSALKSVSSSSASGGCPKLHPAFAVIGLLTRRGYGGDDHWRG